MGIPYYYYNIIRNNEGLLLDTLVECDRLFLDFNSIIHGCSAAVIAKNPGNYTWQQIFEQIQDHTNMVRSICKPKMLMYIAVDGVAPRAKIQQQRRRRYMTAYKNKLINEFKKSNNIPVNDWDSNCITPGTKFMQALDDFLRSTFTTDCMVSGHEDNGEGEHKIFEYIKNNAQDGTDVIYGLDADLILLAMLLGVDTGASVRLMREAQEFESASRGAESCIILDLKFRVAIHQEIIKI
jgi:5'-3' exoribonuclease 1